jgi:hypothetical protein
MTQARGGSGADRNVYVVGAGFSADARLPMMLDFLRVARDAAVWLRQARRRREARAVEQLLTFRQEATRATFRSRIDIDNIEDLFSLASATGDRRLERELTLGIAAVLDYAASVEDRHCCFVHLPPTRRIPAQWGRSPFAGSGRYSNLASVYDHYAAVISGLGADGAVHHRDTVISFNYDLLLEEALGCLKIPFNYGFRPSALNFDDSASYIRRQYRSTGLTVLKLHGSLNWVGPIETPMFAPIPPAKELPGLDQVTLYTDKVTVYGSFGDVRNKDLTPILVPPTWRKSFGSLVSPVWDASIQALREAARIVVIGYSAPATDQHFQYLLAAGIMDNASLESVWIVNPSVRDPDVRTRVTSLFHQGRCGSGVGTKLTLLPLRTTEFFFSRTQLRKINRHDSGLDAKLRLGRF